MNLNRETKAVSGDSNAQMVRRHRRRHFAATENHQCFWEAAGADREPTQTCAWRTVLFGSETQLLHSAWASRAHSPRLALATRSDDSKGGGGGAGAKERLSGENPASPKSLSAAPGMSCAG